MGIGPGSADLISPRALKAIEEADVIVGYKKYISMLKQHMQLNNEVISSGMTKEIERCKTAVNEAKSGKDVTVISSGDPGVYGMAGLVLEMIEAENLKGLELEIIPGITSANASAAKLGAPLMNDYAVISLSDLLTPWDVIEKRLQAAAAADFVLVLYNPASNTRKSQIIKAIDIAKQYRSAATPAGIVRNADRKGEEVILTDLGHLPDFSIDMLCTVIIGNSKTRLVDGYMVTPRGYKL